MLASLSELYGYRELLRNFLVRDVRGRYKGSALGIGWSLLNPLLMMLVYSLVFSIVLRSTAHHYPAFFMAGYLPWAFFAATLQMGSASLLAASGLIQKAYFPREVLPLSITGANLVNLAIGFVVFLPLALWSGGVDGLGVLTLVPVTMLLALFAAGLAMVLSALVVYFRDVEFLLGIVLTAWFFLTPVVYGLQDAPAAYQDWFKLNPMLPFVAAWRDALYRGQVAPADVLLACLVIGVAGFLIPYAAFNRLKRNIAEEL